MELLWELLSTTESEYYWGKVMKKKMEKFSTKEMLKTFDTIIRGFHFYENATDEYYKIAKIFINGVFFMRNLYNVILQTFWKLGIWYTEIKRKGILRFSFCFHLFIVFFFLLFRYYSNQFFLIGLHFIKKKVISRIKTHFSNISILCAFFT